MLNTIRMARGPRSIPNQNLKSQTVIKKSNTHMVRRMLRGRKPLAAAVVLAALSLGLLAVLRPRAVPYLSPEVPLDGGVPEMQVAPIAACPPVLVQGVRSGSSGAPAAGDRSLATVYVITPTYPRAVQVPEMTRLAQTLMLATNVFWVVTEDAKERTAAVTEILEHSGLPYVHILGLKPEKYSKKAGFKGPIPRGVSNRMAAVEWLRQNAKDGVFYFADDDNTYDYRLFAELARTRRASAFPVGLVTETGLSTPVVRDGVVVDFYDGWIGGRVFPMDMAGFAVSVRLLLEHPQAAMPFTAGYEEDGFLKSLGLKKEDLEPLADNCTKILVWHTQTRQPKEPFKPVHPSKYRGTNIEALRPIVNPSPSARSRIRPSSAAGGTPGKTPVRSAAPVSSGTPGTTPARRAAPVAPYPSITGPAAAAAGSRRPTARHAVSHFSLTASNVTERNPTPVRRNMATRRPLRAPGVLGGRNSASIFGNVSVRKAALNAGKVTGGSLMPLLGNVTALGVRGRQRYPLTMRPGADQRAATTPPPSQRSPDSRWPTALPARSRPPRHHPNSPGSRPLSLGYSFLSPFQSVHSPAGFRHSPPQPPVVRSRLTHSPPLSSLPPPLSSPSPPLFSPPPPRPANISAATSRPAFPYPLHPAHRQSTSSPSHSLISQSPLFPSQSIHMPATSPRSPPQSPAIQPQLTFPRLSSLPPLRNNSSLSYFSLPPSQYSRSPLQPTLSPTLSTSHNPIHRPVSRSSSHINPFSHLALRPPTVAPSPLSNNPIIASNLARKP